MNKETRQFIFGLLCVIVCTVGLWLGIRDMRASITMQSFIGNFLFCMLELISILIGIYYILKNI